MTLDPSVYSRNHFDRLSAPEVEMKILMSVILSYQRQLLGSLCTSRDWIHGVGLYCIWSQDSSVYGNNYYDRYGTDHPAVSTVSTKQYPSMRKERAMSNVSETFEFDDDV